MSDPTPPTYNIISPRQPIADKNGIITPEWWRFFQATFMSLGGYQGGGGGGGGGTQPVNLTNLYNLSYSEFGRTGPDYDRKIADLQTTLASLPDYAGRCAALETRVTQLEKLLAATMQPKVDLLSLQRETDRVQALTIGVHH